jgi:hypothetical protein
VSPCPPILCFGDTVMLCSPGWNLKSSCLYVLRLLGLYVYTTTTSSLKKEKKKFFFFSFLFQYWGLNSGPTPWATPPAFFCDGFFWDSVSWTICPWWLQPSILLISASWISRIIHVSHLHRAETIFLWWFYITEADKFNITNLGYIISLNIVLKLFQKV